MKMRLSTLLGVLAHGIVLDSPYDFTAAKLVAGGNSIGVGPSGRLSFFVGGVEVGYWDSIGDLHITGGANVGVADLRLDGVNNDYIYQGGVQILQMISSFGLLKAIANYNGILTAGKGLAAIYGLDNRSGITAADGAPITLYSVPAGANQLFDAAIEIDATAFTSGTATYTLTYTQNGVSQTIVVTATAINVVTGVRRLIQPDPSTLITVQLTGAFVATVRLSAAVMQLA